MKSLKEENKTKYLYGRDNLRGFSKLPYKEVLESKISLTNLLIEELLKEHYLERDSQRINDCISAIKFNEELLKEIK